MEVFEFNGGDLPEELLAKMPEQLRKLVQKEAHPLHQRFHKSVENLTPKPSELLNRTAKMMEMTSKDQELDRIYHRALAIDGLLDYIGDVNSKPQETVRLGMLMLMLERFEADIKRDEATKAKFGPEPEKED